MINLRVRPLDEKHVCISGINPVLGGLLQELPFTLEKRDTPAARSRLLPNPTENDPKANDEWSKIVTPELRHLLVSAGEVVARDLTALQPEPKTPEQFQITFPAEHTKAWMSALNQARLILGELFQIDEQDMNREDLDLTDRKHVAALKIHLLGHLLHLFVILEGGGSPENSV